VTEPQTCKETIRITFVLQDGTKKQVEAPIGKHILELAHENDIDLEGWYKWIEILSHGI
jgi:hypothetical protein